VLKSVCAYPALFEPAAPVGSPLLRPEQVAPAPYVLDPPETPRGGAFAAGEPITIGLRLFGSAGHLAAYAGLALVQAAAGGIGPDRARLLCESPSGAPVAFRTWQPSPPPPPAGHIRVVLETPLRLRLDNDLLTPARLNPAHLVIAALRRVSLLAAHYGSGTGEVDFRALRSLAEDLSWREAEFRWSETVRRSSRQGTAMRLGGVRGWAILDLSAAPQLWPWLWLAQWLHIGKATSMGFGRLRLLPA
jgi:hypothetical protein